ncbi:MAG: hypothetical protein JWO05_2097 [Gemmatimonadetes bacterium]|nr:hypothetical protein [Gemmatimonadota bacterium]
MPERPIPGSLERAGEALLALSLGRVPREGEIPWAMVMELARAERCAGVAWQRSGAWLRAQAPAEVSAAWRADAFAIARQCDRAAERLRDVSARLANAGVEHAVLKGLPLGLRAYGNVECRPSADLDIHVAAAARADAHECLVASGWTLRYGVSPRESAFERPAQEPSGTALLEVHSSLSDDSLVEHLAVQPLSSEVERCRIGEMDVPVLGGAVLPAYLALHLAKHGEAPWLWLLDLHALWGDASEGEREAARDRAGSLRLTRYLEWALASAASLDRAAEGDSASLRRLGIVNGARVRRHNALRVAMLSQTPLDAMHATSGWLWPRAARARSGGLGALRQLASRAALRAARPSLAPPLAPPSAALLSTASIRTIVETVIGAGGSLWIRAYGASMLPAIEPGSRVHLVPPPARTLQRGEVVLAILPGEVTALHRVESECDGVVHLRGDNAVVFDAPVPRDRVLALADAVESRGDVTEIPVRRASSPGLLIRRARHLARRTVERTMERIT